MSSSKPQKHEPLQKGESKDTQLFNSGLSQAGGCACLIMTVWVLQAVWPAPCKMCAHLPWLLGSGLAAETVGGQGGRGE